MRDYPFSPSRSAIFYLHVSEQLRSGYSSLRVYHSCTTGLSRDTSRPHQYLELQPVIQGPLMKKPIFTLAALALLMGVSQLAVAQSDSPPSTPTNLSNGA